jgi:acyl transferase domain-containing protein
VEKLGKSFKVSRAATAEGLCLMQREQQQLQHVCVPEKPVHKTDVIAPALLQARMTVRLAVAGAFHTEYMQPAVEKLLAALDKTEIK